MKGLTTVQVGEKYKVSRSTLYHLLKTGVIHAPEKESNKCLWTPALLSQLEAELEKRAQKGRKQEKPYKTVSINNRRYLGNKHKLLPFIRKVVKENCENISTVADVFAGTGAVASAFRDKKLIVNDNLYSNYICHMAWFGTEPIAQERIRYHIQFYNEVSVSEDNYMSDNFGDTYFSREVCRKIGFIREDIEQLYAQGEVNFRERAVLITSLLYAIDKIANTCGHYDAYRKNGDLSRGLELSVPQADNDLNTNNQCFNLDANELVRQIEADLVYIDPPYNSRQYCDIYHLLENVAKWEKPVVAGEARKMERKGLKSDYCTRKATGAFEDLVRNIHAKYILLSYNNMAEKGDGRSNAKITDEDIWRILSAKGETRVFSAGYKAFTTGKSNIAGNEERLFLCICRNEEKPLLQSPLNYTGGKFKLLPQLLPLFPKKIGTFVDLFCGGCNVGINANAARAVFQDGNAMLIEMLVCLQKTDKAETFDRINGLIDAYGLSRSNELGYAHYGCNGGDGLAASNKAAYLALRTRYNEGQDPEKLRSFMLYLLVVYSFNNQIRFNRKGAFNLPVGKRDFNANMQAKLSAFIDRLKSGDYHFYVGDFREFDMGSLDADSFVYCDPPYLITCASYNEQNGWNEDCERALLARLEELTQQKIRFALSNVLRSRGRENTILLEWVKKNKKKCRVIPLDYSYANSNYHLKDKTTQTQEVLIVNYGKGLLPENPQAGEKKTADKKKK